MRGHPTIQDLLYAIKKKILILSAEYVYTDNFRGDHAGGVFIGNNQMLKDEMKT